MGDRPPLGRDLLVLFALTGWALALPAFGSDFAVSMGLSCLMYIALATSAFFGIGACSSALTLEQLGWAAAVATGAAIATAVALVMGALVLHLRGTYVAMLAFGMTELIRHAISYWEEQVDAGKLVGIIGPNGATKTTLLTALAGLIPRRGSVMLAPKMVAELLATTRRIADAGTTVLMVEQNVKKALAVADRGYVLERGALVASGSAKLLARSSVVREAYLGAAAATGQSATSAKPRQLRHSARS